MTYFTIISIILFVKEISGVPRVSGARGEDENWRPLPPACRTSKRRRRSPLLLGGGLGRSPSHQRFLEYLGVNGTHFWIAFNTIFNSTCQTDKRRKRFPLLLGKGGSGAEPQPPTLLGAFGCEWNPFLNSVNTIFNSACNTDKRLRCSPSLLGGLGRSSSSQRLWENLGVNGNHFSIALTTFWTLLAPTAGMQPAARIVRVSSGNSRRGAAVNFTCACRQAHTWGLWYVHQNARLYVQGRRNGNRAPKR